MTEGNQLWRLFCCHNASNPSNRQYVTFGHLSGNDEVQYFWCQVYRARCNGFSMSDRLFGDIDHASASLRINVAQFLHKFLNKELERENIRAERIDEGHVKQQSDPHESAYSRLWSCRAYCRFVQCAGESRTPRY